MTRSGKKRRRRVPSVPILGVFSRRMDLMRPYRERGLWVPDGAGYGVMTYYVVLNLFGKVAKLRISKSVHQKLARGGAKKITRND